MMDSFDTITSAISIGMMPLIHFQMKPAYDVVYDLRSVAFRWLNMETGEEILDRVIAFGGSGDLAGSRKGGRRDDARNRCRRRPLADTEGDEIQQISGTAVVGHFPLSNPIVHPYGSHFVKRKLPDGGVMAL